MSHAVVRKELFYDGWLYKIAKIIMIQFGRHLSIQSHTRLLSALVLLISVFASSGSAFATRFPANLMFVHGEALLISKIQGHTAKLGSVATFSLALSEQPSANVVVPIASSDMNEAVVRQDHLVFTTVNWDAAQLVEVVGNNSRVVDGRQNFHINLGPLQSEDDRFNGIKPPSVVMRGITMEIPSDASKITFVPYILQTLHLPFSSQVNVEKHSIIQGPLGLELSPSGDFLTWEPMEFDAGKRYDVEIERQYNAIVRRNQVQLEVLPSVPVEKQRVNDTFSVTDRASSLKEYKFNFPSGAPEKFRVYEVNLNAFEQSNLSFAPITGAFYTNSYDRVELLIPYASLSASFLHSELRYFYLDPVFQHWYDGTLDINEVEVDGKWYVKLKLPSTYGIGIVGYRTSY